LNFFRMAVYSKIRTEQVKAGKKVSIAERKQLAHRINDLTGRSHIRRTAATRTLTPLLNALFSPRFTISRFKPIVTLPADLIKSLKDGKLRAEAKLGLTSLISLMTTNFLIMLLLKLFDDKDKIKIETDLQSSDGGKVKIGDTRLDLWSGYLQPAQLLVRLATGKRKTGAGEIIKADRGQLFEDFGRSKLNPLLSLVIDAYTGRTFYGGKFLGPPKGKPGEIMTEMEVPSWVQGVSKEVWNRMVPLVIQDTADALMDAGVPMAVTAGTFSFFGGGAQTYLPYASTKLHIEENKLAQKRFKKPWDDLTEQQQKLLRNQPVIKELQIQKVKERKAEGPARIDWILAEQDKLAREIQSQLPKAVQKKMAELGVSVSAPSRRIGEWYLNDKRYDFYKQETIRQMKLLFGPGKTMPLSAKAFTHRMDMAKTIARQKLRRAVAEKKL